MKTSTALLALKNGFRLINTADGRITFGCPPIACVDCVFGGLNTPQRCDIAKDIYIGGEQLAELTSSHPELFI